MINSLRPSSAPPGTQLKLVTTQEKKKTRTGEAPTRVRKEELWKIKRLMCSGATEVKVARLNLNGINISGLLP